MAIRPANLSGRSTIYRYGFVNLKLDRGVAGPEPMCMIRSSEFGHYTQPLIIQMGS